MKLSLLLLFAILFVIPNFLSAQEPMEREVYLMGTTFKVTLFEDNESRGLAQLEAMVRVVEETEDQLSTWRPASELSTINQRKVGESLELSPTLCPLMQNLREWTDKTGGAFDPTVGQLLKIWGIQSSRQIPDRSSIQRAVTLTGFQHIRQNRCSLEKEAGVIFDAGAFGKGEALDRVAELMKTKDFAPAILDFGGQILAWRPNQPIRVTLADPANRNRKSPVTVKLSSGSLSTSGGSERDQTVNGKRVGHIVDPRTGYPVPFFGSVTVWNQKALDADILSTALYVMGPEKGYQWAEQHQIAACFLLRDGKKPLATAEFRKLMQE